MGNNELIKARKEKNDEFYTKLSTIEKELIHYSKHFKDKTVYLNCDDPRKSKFFHYFVENFQHLELKSVIASFYKKQDYNLFNLGVKEDKPFWVEYTGGELSELCPSKSKNVHFFKGDGDFRSEESIRLLKKSDIVVTNPPFSLFKEFVSQMFEYEKDFLILGTVNAVTYKTVFPLIRENRMWPGVLFNNSVEFDSPSHYYSKKDLKEGNVLKVTVTWWTNMEHSKRHRYLTLTEKYEGNEQKYPKFDNYNAININKLSDIPKDYNDMMGVPITFIGKWNPRQFEIIGLTGQKNIGIRLPSAKVGRAFVEGKEVYRRLLIKKIK